MTTEALEAARQTFTTRRRRIANSIHTGAHDLNKDGYWITQSGDPPEILVLEHAREVEIAFYMRTLQVLIATLCRGRPWTIKDFLKYLDKHSTIEDL